MENLILDTHFKITSADADMNARLRLGSLVNLLIQSSIQSADALGFGFESLKEHRLLWVLSRLEVEIKRPLVWNETVKVQTWPKNLEKLFYTRDFIVTDSLGNEVAKATSAWLAIDNVSRRPKIIEGSMADLFTHHKNKHALEPLAPKLDHVQSHDSTQIIPTFFDYDLNGHVTSTRYIDWVMDTFDYKFHAQHYPSYLCINYLKELKAGEPVNLIKDSSQAEGFLFEGININQNCPSFRTQIRF